LLHAVNHAVFKALLFLAAGSFDRAVHDLELDRLGGLLRRMPWSGWAFVVGAAAIAGLAPLNGFVSEWLTIEALFHLTLVPGVAPGIAGALALATLGLAIALAVLCFVKVTGLVLLGPARRPATDAAREAPWAMRAGLVALAAWCVVLGALPGPLVRRLAAIVPGATGLSSSVRLHPPGTGGLPTLALALVVIGLVGGLTRLRGTRVAASSPTWICGQDPSPALRVTSAGFSKPVRLVLEVILRPEREVSSVEVRGIVRSVAYRGRVPLLIEERIYAPVAAAALRGAKVARRLQSGRLSTYAVYLAALLVTLLACARLGLLG
jgi:hydrogenase-4 component B